MTNRSNRTFRRAFRVGDRVRFRGYQNMIKWGKRKPQEFGFIVSINGAYIMVRPRWWKAQELIERYPNELELAE
jgi:hypothetical protein